MDLDNGLRFTTGGFVLFDPIITGLPGMAGLLRVLLSLFSLSRPLFLSAALGLGAIGGLLFKFVVVVEVMVDNGMSLCDVASTALDNSCDIVTKIEYMIILRTRTFNSLIVSLKKCRA